MFIDAERIFPDGERMFRIGECMFRAGKCKKYGGCNTISIAWFV